MIRLLTAVILMAGCLASPSGVLAEKGPQTALPAPGEESFEEKADAFHKKVSDTILNSAAYFDDFFSDERYILEDNHTRLLIRPGIGYEKGGDFESKLRISLRLRLPKTENRLNLLFSGNIDDENDLNRSALDTPLNRYEDGKDNSFHAALQYITQATKRHNLRIHGGVRVSSDPQLYGGARYRFYRPMEKWDFRFIQRARWYTRDKWEFRSTVDFDREFSKRYLFRLAVDGTWLDKDDNFTYSVKPALNQYLSRNRAIKYEWATYFESRPAHRVTSTVLSVNYRQRIWRDWLLYELTPQIAFPRDNDFDFTPGISLQFEIEFGHVNKNKDLKDD
ncbi:MAG: hypothetical protein MI863_19720 [Desulfobacterales bacterium]|nr:hypothetical protein [Desulfobacterales bacterium]